MSADGYEAHPDGTVTWHGTIVGSFEDFDRAEEWIVEQIDLGLRMADALDI